MSAKTEWIGLGTAIERVTKRVGIRTCAKCRGRKRRLNRVAPRFWKTGSVGWSWTGKPPVQEADE
jgi:hypothetical protein